jgi:hypothetical protein
LGSLRRVASFLPDFGAVSYDDIVRVGATVARDYVQEINARGRSSITGIEVPPTDAAGLMADGITQFFDNVATVHDRQASGWSRLWAGVQVVGSAWGGLRLLQSLKRIASPAVKAAQEATNLASARRTRHILYGDETGGGHKFGLLRLFNGKTKFPAAWSEREIMNAVSEVATSPSSTWVQQSGRAGAILTRAGAPVKWKVEGVFNGIRIRVIVQGDDIVTAFPIG